MSGTYSVEVTKTAVVIPSPGGDLYPNEDPDVFMFSAIQGTQFIIDVAFKLFETTEVSDESGISTVTTPVNIININSSFDSQYSSVTFQVIDSDPLNYTIRVTGNIVDVILGETYTFVLPTNDPTQGFPISTTSVTSVPTGYLAIISWVLPSVFWVLLSDVYTFTINPSGENIDYNMSQYVYWDRTLAITNFGNIVTQGVL